MKWNSVDIIDDNGQQVKAIAPIIISASRATDIPAFYGDWFMSRLKLGHVKWQNKFNKKYCNVSFAATRLIVFWTKNPEPFFKHLDTLDEAGVNYYFQFTLNDYENEKLENGVPLLPERIETFIRLSERIGKEKIIWRFDPLVLSEATNVQVLLEKIKRVGEKLIPYTNKLVFSFADIANYNTVQRNMKKYFPSFEEWKKWQMIDFAKQLHEVQKIWKRINPDFKVATCAEDIDLSAFDILPNKCIDDELIARLFSEDEKLMNFLNAKNLKDKGQRKLCNCIMSKDIGQYNTCAHGCVYCYANTDIF